MKVVLAVYGTRGDVHPMLALARSISAGGHEIRFVAPPDFAGDVHGAGFEAISIGPPAGEWLDAMSTVYGGGQQWFSRRLERFHGSAMSSQFRVLPDAVAGTDMVLASSAVFAAASAAELHGVPYRFVAHAPPLIPSADHAPWISPVQPRARWINRALWWGTRRGLRFWASRGLDGHREKLGLPKADDVLTHLLSRRPIVAVDRPLAPVRAEAGIHFDQIRALHPLHGEPLPPELEAFLNAGPPPVYIGFGSCPDSDPAVTTGIVLDAVERTGFRALISRGWAGIGEGDLPAGVMTIGPVAHQSLFPRLAAVVHHGGAGTIHAAARAGVPQLVVPHLFDMSYWARRVEDLGIGPKGLPRKRMTAARLATRIARAVENPTYAARSRALASELAALGPVEPDLDVILRAPA